MVVRALGAGSAFTFSYQYLESHSSSVNASSWGDFKRNEEVKESETAPIVMFVVIGSGGTLVVVFIGCIIVWIIKKMRR